MKELVKVRSLGVVVVLAMLVAACTGGASPSASTATQAPASSAAASESASAEPSESTAASEEPSGSAAAGDGEYTIGYSNAGGVGNGFREEQVCTAKAEATASGQVTELTVIHRVTDAAGQLSDLRTLVSAGVDAIVFNPNDPDALTPALEEAAAAGIITVSVDAFVNHPETYNLYNNQEEYAYIGAKWLFEHIGGEGTVWYMRGFAGHPADTDRHTGFNRAREEFPNITVVPSDEGTHTQWDPATATQVANEFLAGGGYGEVDGIWTSGMDSQVVDAIKSQGLEYKPIVGADLGGFVDMLLNTSGEFEGLEGAAVTNTASVGGAGVNLALKLLNGESVETDPDAAQPNTVLLDPVLGDNVSEEGRATLESWKSVEGLDPLWPLSLEIEGWTSYDPQDAIPPDGCKGPGE